MHSPLCGGFYVALGEEFLEKGRNSGLGSFLSLCSGVIAWMKLVYVLRSEIRLARAQCSRDCWAEILYHGA